MHATLVTVHDPFHPVMHREVRTLSLRGPLSACAPKTDKPFIITHNGKAVLRADWDRPVERGDVVAVVMLPQGGGGGGGSNPLSVVLQVALMVFAAPFAGAYAGLLSGSELVGMAASGLTMLAGSMLINAIIPPPKPPTPQATTAMAAPSPTYTLQAQGNMARLDSPIPVQYGRMMCFPDFAAQPYAEFAGNEQYLYQLLCVGQGDFTIEAIRIDQSALSSWADITYEVIAPGGSISLFPSNVVTSSSVAGQEALTGVNLGPFIASASGTSANTIAIDVVCSRGLYHANTSGGLDSVSLTFTVEAQLVDGAGTPVGSWVTLGTQTITAATTTPQRYSYHYNVAPGRYQVQLRRTDTKQTDTSYGHELDWAGLRAYLPETRDFGNITLIALRMKASNNLSNAASRKINVIVTRKLFTWSPGGGWSGNAVATSSIAWALADALKNSEYGAGLADSQIDLAALYALDATWTSRGDEFNGRFDNSMTLWESLTVIARAGRAKPYLQGGIVHFSRDQAQTVPVALFSMRNIVKGSFSVEYLTPTPNTADAVAVKYFDRDNWAIREVPAALSGSASLNPASIDLSVGVTLRAHAYREGLYQAASNQYRRKIIRLSSEMEGFIPAYGDLIAVAHDMPQWGQGSEAVDWNASTKILTLSEPMTFGAGTHYIGLRKRDGSMEGPITVTAGVDAYHLVLATSPTFTPYTGDAEERTHVVFGWGETYRQLAIVTAVRPRGLYQVDIEAVNEDPSVHTADTGVTAPPVQSSQLNTVYTAPVIAGLIARSMPGAIDKMLLSWQAAPGADYYIIEQSSDGQTWTRSGEPTSNNYNVTALYGAATIVRVCAIGLTKGPWVQIAYGGVAGYMWNAVDTTLMWNATDTTPMWSA